MDASLFRDKRIRALKAAKQPSIRKTSPPNLGGPSNGYGIKVPKA